MNGREEGSPPTAGRDVRWRDGRMRSGKEGVGVGNGEGFFQKMNKNCER